MKFCKSINSLVLIGFVSPWFNIVDEVQRIFFVVKDLLENCNSLLPTHEGWFYSCLNMDDEGVIGRYCLNF